MTPRTRSLTEAFPSLRDGDGVPLCVVCRTPMSGRSWNARYCGEPCRVEAYIRCGDTYTIRYHLFERERGICEGCGVDLESLEKTANRARRLSRRGHLETVAKIWERDQLDEMGRKAEAIVRGIAIQIAQAARARIGALVGWDHLWEANHRVPVIEGGGGCGLDGYELLCVPCHKAETKRQAARRAWRRRAEKPNLQLGLPLALATEEES